MASTRLLYFFACFWCGLSRRGVPLLPRPATVKSLFFFSVTGFLRVGVARRAVSFAVAAVTFPVGGARRSCRHERVLAVRRHSRVGADVDANRALVRSAAAMTAVAGPWRPQWRRALLLSAAHEAAPRSESGVGLARAQDAAARRSSSAAGTRSMRATWAEVSTKGANHELYEAAQTTRGKKSGKGGPAVRCWGRLRCFFVAPQVACFYPACGPLCEDCSVCV